MKRHISYDVKARIKAREDVLTEKRKIVYEVNEMKKMEKEWNEQKLKEDKKVKYAYVEPKLLETTKATE